MAKTIAYAVGRDKSRVKETHRLGSESASGKAATWETFATVTVNADGSGTIAVDRTGYGSIFSATFNTEDQTPVVHVTASEYLDVLVPKDLQVEVR